MNLAKTSLLNGLAVLTKLATSLFLSKVIAVYVGPAGYGVIGQFQNLVGIVSTLASGAVNTGVTRYTAEYVDEKDRQLVVWGTASGLGLIGAAVCALALVLAREPLARWALGDVAHAGVLVWLGASLVFLVLNGLMLAILTGRKAVRGLVAANIAGSLISAALAGALVATRGLEGALVAIAVGQALACGVTVFVLRRSCGIAIGQLFGRIDPQMARRLGAYALMAATSALATPLAQVFIRDRLATDLGWASVGLWQALWKISEMHLMLLTTTLSVYLLPRFSEIQDPAELSHEVRAAYRFVLPLSLATSAAIYLLRTPLVHGLLTAEFLPLVGLLGVQLVGDLLKINSWVMAYTMVSHAMTRTFIATEIAFSLLLGVSTVLLSQRWGLLGATVAYALTYAIYWLVMAIVFRSLLAALRRRALARVA
ncbi:O-antigen translocase [Rivibacter subsaxonicus]|uniref:PST family polysaccharide transporter n=1 Tax=Rivibacter subsaxonicus TaxID=457575 RepID=A0A4Q7VGS2_9BURK|nr:O-antigen translocase [Rivibacter subsaxonicus]RZT95243.1 PST family polysaccharide transporter [Rivibacter subsaxonicus]